VGAAAPEIPQTLVEQLAIGGRMLIPVGKYNQEFLQIDKLANGRITQKRLYDVIYVPLTSKTEQIARDGSL
jgi:protein-L-isoaspartate(D-aspartate) O-methyltransferase